MESIFSLPADFSKCAPPSLERNRPLLLTNQRSPFLPMVASRGQGASLQLGASDLMLSGNPLVSMSRKVAPPSVDRKSTRLNSSHRTISYAVFCLKKKKT